MIRVAIAEEHAIVRWALCQALAGQPGIDVVGSAGNVEETLSLIRQVKPEVLILDAAIDGLAAIRELDTAPLIVVLGPYSEPHCAARAITSGAHGYVARAEPPALLLRAIEAVSRGEQVVPPDVEELVAAGDIDPAGRLTNREQQVMEMLARGMTNREIGDYLTISVKTVDTHRAHLLKKLSLRNNAEVTRFAVKNGYVTL